MIGSGQGNDRFPRLFAVRTTVEPGRDKVRRPTDSSGIFSARGTVVGDLLWFLVIAFVCAIITGVLG